MNRDGSVVASRSLQEGQRTVHLSKLFTTKKWMDAFVRQLAEADAQYFDRGGEHDKPLPPASSPAPFALRRRAPIGDIEPELDDAGL